MKSPTIAPLKYKCLWQILVTSTFLIFTASSKVFAYEQISRNHSTKKKEQLDIISTTSKGTITQRRVDEEFANCSYIEWDSLSQELVDVMSESPAKWSITLSGDGNVLAVGQSPTSSPTNSTGIGTITVDA